MIQLKCFTSVGQPPTPNSCDTVPPFQIVYRGGFEYFLFPPLPGEMIQID